MRLLFVATDMSKRTMMTQAEYQSIVKYRGYETNVNILQYKQDMHIFDKKLFKN